MSDNWEFALSHIGDGYVMYLGDDDGLLPGALADISRIIDETGTEAMGWQSAAYHWPRHPDPAARNMLSIPLGTDLRRYHSREVLASVLDMKRHYRELPILYKGVASYKCIRRVLLESGRFFWSLNPDVYSAIAMGSVIDTYYYSQNVYSVDGASHHSIGTSYFGRDSDKKVAAEFLSEDNLPFHAKLILVQSMPVLVAECALQAHDHIAAARQFPIDIKRVLEATIAQALSLPEEQYQSVVNAVKEMGKRNGLDGSVSEITRPRRQNDRPKLKPVPGINKIKDRLLVDCLQFSARNVFDAADLCKHLLVMKDQDYFSVKGIARTTCGLFKREIVRRFCSASEESH
jgi:hypothetical protein